MADELSFPEVPMYCQICGARIPTGPKKAELACRACFGTIAVRRATHRPPKPDDDSLLSDVPPIELGLIPTKEENT
jgi:hypothetical protein